MLLVVESELLSSAWLAWLKFITNLSSEEVESSSSLEEAGSFFFGRLRGGFGLEELLRLTGVFLAASSAALAASSAALAASAAILGDLLFENSSSLSPQISF